MDPEPEPAYDPSGHALLDEVLDLLRRMSEVLVHAENTPSAMQQIVGIIAGTLHADDCSIYVYNAGEKTLSLAASYALSPAAVGSVICRADEGIIGEAFRTQQTLNIANHPYHPRYKSIAGIGEEVFHTCLAVPLSFVDRNLGVLVLQSRGYTLFPPRTVDMVRSLSAQTANLLLNAELFEHTLAVSAEPEIVKSSRKLKLNGTIVSPGVSIGYAYRIRTTENLADIPLTRTENPDHELELLSRGVVMTKQQTLALEQCALSLLTEADASIFTTHLLMLDDQLLNDRLRETVRQGPFTAETAIKETFFFFEEKFSRLSDPIFRERIIDLKDILLRLAENIERLRDDPAAESSTEIPVVKGRPLILVAEDLLPSQLMRIPIDSIRGIICEHGGSTSHAAILAKAMDIPALMAVKGVMDSVNENDELLIDAHAGVIHITPDDELKEEYEAILSAVKTATHETRPPGKPEGAVTADGVQITIRANLSLLNETAQLLASRAQGVGLYRSEFMFMMRESLPSEQDQYNIFAKLVRSANGQPVTIRILDIGADKPVPCLPMPKEENPALGVRAIRMLLQRPDILMPHLRAILRAGAVGPVRILLPMVATVSEVFLLKERIAEAKAKLDATGMPYGTCQMGIMMETPSLLFELHHVLPEVDFLSVGSNDLIQYLFAADRGNAALSYLTNPLNSTFMFVLREIAELCKEHHVSASVCGELAGSYYAAPILAGLGFRELSMSPKRIPTIRDVLSRFTLKECEEAAAYACTYSRDSNITEYMKNMFMRRDVSTATVSLPKMSMPKSS